MTHRRRIPSGNLALLILLGFACVLAAIWFLLMFMARQMFGGGPEPARSLAQVTDLTRFNFPPGSVLIDGEVCRCWHSHAFARISLPRAGAGAVASARIYRSSEADPRRDG